MSLLNAAAREFNNLKTTLEALADAVIAQLRALEAAATRRDRNELRAIVARDQEIDALELNLDRLARSFMELRAPLGPDFRYVMAALDIARNLERIGDCTEYVARHIDECATLPDQFAPAWDIILSMIAKCREILELAHASWLKADARLAGRIPAEDDTVDSLQDEAYDLVVEQVRAGKVDVELGLNTVLIVNKLESIADITSHIAESVVFVIQARQIRHEKRPEL